MTTQHYDYKGNGFEVKKRERVLNVELCYPRVDEERVNAVEVGLMDVRAADSIRIAYDFKRDGWSVLQASTFEWSSDDSMCDADWREVAFIKAWARKREGERL